MAGSRPCGQGSPGELETSDAVAAPYAELQGALRHAAVLNADETGHRTNGEKRWLWTFVARTFVVYRIAASPGGRRVAADVGRDLRGHAGQ
jgi:hypothetical protein